MNIQEAALLATEKLVTMNRKEWKESHQTVVFPTNDTFLQCLLCSKDGNRIIKYWQPTADDLIANDWEVNTSLIDQE